MRREEYQILLKLSMLMLRISFRLVNKGDCHGIKNGLSEDLKFGLLSLGWEEEYLMPVWILATRKHLLFQGVFTFFSYSYGTKLHAVYNWRQKNSVSFRSVCAAGLFLPLVSFLFALVFQFTFS